MVVANGRENDARRLSAELHAFHELARVVASGPYTADEIVERICKEVRTGFGFDRALLARYDAEQGTLHAYVQQNIDWPGDAWLPLDMFPFLQRALAERRAVYVPDAASTGAVPEKIVARFAVGSLVGVPLVTEDRCVGFLVCDRRSRRDHFDVGEQELLLLSTLGRVAAVFIDKADQYSTLEHALEELRRVDQTKTDFVGVASHELRTPIAVVHGIASTLHLRGHELTDDQLDELRQTLFEQTTRLAALAQSLLDLSRIDAGSVRPEPQRFRPRERIETLLSQIAPDRLGDVRVVVRPDLELVTDPDALERIVANLVTNALHYGAPPVKVQAVEAEPFRLLVEDHGNGVDPGFVERLFDRFSRGRESERQRVGGAGLGLAIARSYAVALGGDLLYEDRCPGARFALELPGAVAVSAAP
jgi:signal transduction histidine kinase